MTITERAIGRNETRIEASDDGVVFVKRIIGPADDAERRYRNCLAFDAAQEAAMGAPPSPPLQRRDDADRLLAYRYLPDALSLQDYLADWVSEGWALDHPFLPAVERAGELLAATHLLPLPDVPSGGSNVRPLRKFRWLTADEFAAASGGELACWRLFHHDAELQEAVDRWLDHIRPVTERVVAHGDVRPDQFLIVGDLASDDGIVLIDWEEFGPGWRSRDLAGVVGAVIHDALRSTFTSDAAAEVDPVAAHRALLAAGRRNLGAAQPAIHRTLLGYERIAGVLPDPEQLSADVGFYLIERTIGRSMVEPTMRPTDRAIAGIARRALIEPASFRSLLNLSVPIGKE